MGSEVKKFEVSFQVLPNARFNKEVEAENEKEAMKIAKDFFTGIVGKDKIKVLYNNKNVVVKDITPLPTTDYQEDI